MMRPGLVAASCVALLLLSSLLLLTACSTAPGQPAANSQVIPPGKIADFETLYSQNCAGCHGPDGKGGVAIGLANQVYLAIADDATINRVTANGVPGTAMPAFAQHSGGMLSDDQINAIVRGVRAWARSNALGGVEPPPYGPQNPGKPEHGAAVFATYCASCHGDGGRGGKSASSIVDRSYLALVSDQNLRTAVIVGRPELGAPDWRADVPGKPMSPEEISDVVAWLASQRDGGNTSAIPSGAAGSNVVRLQGGIR